MGVNTAEQLFLLMSVFRFGIGWVSAEQEASILATGIL
jgi:hypothetical protein